MTSKRNPLLTAKGTRYTYAGWVRVYHAALKSGVPNLAYRLAESYPEHYNKHQEQARKRDLGSRQHAPSPGVPRSTARKRNQPRTEKPLKSNQYRTMSGRVATIPAKQKTKRPHKEFTKEQRRLIAKALRLEQKRDDHRLSDVQHRIILHEQRQAELKLYRLNKDARNYLDEKIRDYQDKKHNRSMRDIKKKEAFQKGRFTAGYWLG